MPLQIDVFFSIWKKMEELMIEIFNEVVLLGLDFQLFRFGV